MNLNHHASRISKPVTKAVRPALRTAFWLVSIMLPVSFAATLLQYTGVLDVLAFHLQPFFAWMGLRGEGALVILTAAGMTLYSGIAVMQAIPFTMREITIMALMMLVAHNLIVETAVQSKTGSRAVHMVLLRLAGAVACGLFLHAVLPPDDRIMVHGMTAGHLPLSTVLTNWLSGSLMLTLMIVCIVVSLRIFQELLTEYGIMQWSTRLMAPLMKPMGLPATVSFPWIISYVIGLAYGSSTLIEHRRSGELPKRDSDLLNHHIAVSHYLVEDTLVFVALGVSVWWITLPRIALATVVVWGKRAVDSWMKKRPATCN